MHAVLLSNFMLQSILYLIDSIPGSDFFDFGKNLVRRRLALWAYCLLVSTRKYGFVINLPKRIFAPFCFILTFSLPSIQLELLKFLSEEIWQILVIYSCMLYGRKKFRGCVWNLIQDWYVCAGYIWLPAEDLWVPHTGLLEGDSLHQITIPRAHWSVGKAHQGYLSGGCWKGWGMSQHTMKDMLRGLRTPFLFLAQLCLVYGYV